MVALGLLPEETVSSSSLSDQKQMRCLIRLHRSAEGSVDIPLSVYADDTLSDLKKRVVGQTGGAATRASDLYAWHTLQVGGETATAYVVNLAMDGAGTSASIGPRIVTEVHLWYTYDRLVSLHARRTSAVKGDGERSLTYSEAVAVVKSRGFAHGETVSVPLGVSHSHHHQRQVMVANPYEADVEVDPHLSSRSGDPLDLYETSTMEDTYTLETILKANEATSDHHIDMTCASDLGIHASHSTSLPEQAWRVGFLRKYFPLHEAWTASRGASQGDGEEAVHFARKLSALEETFKHARRHTDRKVEIERCVVTSVKMQFGQTAAKTRQSLDQSTGYDILTRIFNRFRVTRDVPVVRYVGGDDTTQYKVARIALTAKSPEVTEYLARCTRLALNIATMVTKPSRVARKPSLHFLVTLGQGGGGQTANVHLRQDLSYTVVRTFSTSSVNGGGSFEDVTATYGFVIKRVMEQVWRSVHDVSATTEIVHNVTPLRGWQDLDVMVGSLGSSLSLGSSFTIHLSAGRVPSTSELRDVLDRMYPFFVTVPTPDGDGIFLQYRRVDGFEDDSGGLLQSMRLMRDEPTDVMTAKVARAFGCSLDEASRRIEANLRNGKIPYVLDLLRSGVSVVLHSSNRGIACRVNGAESATQHRRILRLLLVAVDAARLRSGFLSWTEDEESVVTKKKRSRRRYLHDWEEEDDDEDDDDEQEHDSDEDERDIDEMLAAELASQRQIRSRTSDASSVSGRLGDISLGRATQESMLRDIQRSDPALFHFNKSGYSTTCGKVNGRQPIVITKEELAGMDPSSHTGAIAYGSTQEAAERNRFICPDVWCPRSRVSLSVAQFKEAGGRCPLETEVPTVLDNEYFKGRTHYVGFLKPSKHPEGLCMPCCFRLPRQRYGLCTGADDPGFYAREDSVATDTKEDDPRYLRNQRAHLDDGRYGLIPADLVELLGGVQRCGGREDGSGQMNLKTNCFVRRGTTRHSQVLMSGLVWMLDNPACGDIKSLVALIARRLTPDVFVTLNDGRMARVLMREVIAAEQEQEDDETERDARFVAWIGSNDARAYVDASRLEGVLREAKGPSGGRSLDFRRERLIHSAMMRFVEVLRDPSVIKRHEHLLDLCSRPLAWLNPTSMNVLMFDVSDTDDSVSFECPFGGGALERHIRLSDPFALLLRKGSWYQPVVRVHMSRRDGIQEKRTFSYDSDRFLHQTMYRLLEGCRGGAVSGVNDDVVGMLVTGLRAIGRPPGWQVLDYGLRLVGIMTLNHMYVSLATWTTPLVGHAATGLGTLYIADAVRLHTQAVRKETIDEVMGRLRVATGVTTFGSLPTDGGSGPALMLEHLGVFVGAPVEDRRLRDHREAQAGRHRREIAVRRFREALWEDASAASELVFLRHGFNPLPPRVRRALTLSLINRLMPSTVDRPVPDGFVDHLLFASDPLSHPKLVVPVTHGALRLTDVDLMSSSLTDLLARGTHSLDGRLTETDEVSISSSGSGNRSLISMRKGLTSSPTPSLSPSSMLSSSPAVTTVVTGAKMLRCHPWRAMSLAQSLVHTDLSLSVGLPLMLMENDRIAKTKTKTKTGKKSPSDPTYEPDEHDVDVIASAFDITVRVIRRGVMLPPPPAAATATLLRSSPVLILAWLDDGSWHVVLSDAGRIMWDGEAVNNISPRIQGVSTK